MKFNIELVEPVMKLLLLIRVISVKAGSILLVWDTFIQDVPVDIKRDLK